MIFETTTNDSKIESDMMTQEHNLDGDVIDDTNLVDIKSGAADEKKRKRDSFGFGDDEPEYKSISSDGANSKQA